MADLIIKPNSATGNKLILQDQAGNAVLTTDDSAGAALGGNLTVAGTLTGSTGGTGDFNWDSNTLVVDSSASNVGIGTVVPETWTGTLTALGIGGNARVFSETSAGAGNGLQIHTNAYHNSGFKYITANDEAANYTQADGTHLFRVSSSTSHAADSAVTWIEAMTI
ncbi:MAG: hypothetical protein QF535_00990, partial [Anaerolineales bacterium]|nr:hypothetical protein [Anaerolineales bacterium]